MGNRHQVYHLNRNFTIVYSVIFLQNSNCADSSMATIPGKQQHACHEFLVYIIPPVPYQGECVMLARWQYSKEKLT